MTELADLLARLVAIDSVNPSLVRGGAGESEIAAFIATWAGAGGPRGRTDRRRPRPAERRRPRPRHGRRAHAAAVRACRHRRRRGHARPVRRRDAARLGLRGDVILAAVADAHKGFVWSEVNVTGRAAHGSRPQLGVDAIAKAGSVLAGLGALDAALGAHEHPLLGRASVHASTITGGAELSSYPAGCTIGLERRTLPGETAAAVEAQLEALLDRCRAADPGLSAERRTLLVREPFEADPGAPLVEAVARAAGGAAVGGVSYWADSALIAAAGIPTVLHGPAGHGAHGDDEWVSLGSMEAVARTLTAVAAELCA
jgi:acetylornithine deacetylase